MKVLKILVIIVVVLVGGFAIWMATLPPTFSIERTTEINAPANKAYKTVADLTTWKSWSYWDQMDSTNVVTYNDTNNEVGAAYSWKGTKTGEGTFTVTALEEDKSLDYTIAFKGMGEGTGSFTFNEVDGNTTVSYSFNTEFSFWNRMGSIFMDTMMDEAFTESLANLKVLVEALPVEVSNSINIETMDNSSVAFYAITEEVPMADINSAFFGSKYGELGAYLAEDAAQMTGPPFAIYSVWDEETKMATISVALAVNSDKPANDRIEKGMTHEGKVLRSDHWGDYAKTGENHMAMDEYGRTNGLKLGAPWEVFVTDPGTEADTAKWLTQVYYPILEATEDNSVE